MRNVQFLKAGIKHTYSLSAILNGMLLFLLFAGFAPQYSLAQCPATFTISAPSRSRTATTGTYTVPAGGPYKLKITAKGAKGGNYSSTNGGAGATMVGEFSVTAGQVLELVAGAPGNDRTYNVGGGGGGGSAVRIQQNGALLIVAGGGSGGGGFAAGSNGANSPTGSGISGGGTSGQGNLGESAFNGTGGKSSDYYGGGDGGGGAGGGGGGAAGFNHAPGYGGGGGGYSGGSGGSGGGGGGSFNAGTNQSNTAGPMLLAAR